MLLFENMVAQSVENHQNGDSEVNVFVDQKADQLEKDVISWRRHLHEYPELSNREYETSRYIAQHLEALGIEVRKNVAHTGLVGILKGGKPGKVVALRADMDALPVVERADLPFASKVKSTYLGSDVGVMHACGHDTHVAMLMGAASILSSMRDKIEGTIVFLFQPAEEGAPPGEKGGASLMIEEGALDNPEVEAVFGIHIQSYLEVGKIKYKPGGALAAADRFVIKVKGVQSHGSAPWTGVDPIVTSAQIIMGLQTIISRQTELTKEAAVISIGKIQGGVRNNIIPEECEMIGTIRTLDTEMQDIIHQKIRHTAMSIAESMGATAEVQIQKNVPVTYNHLDLTRRIVPTLYDVAGEDNVFLSRAITGAEDFSFYANKIPGFFVFLGGQPKGYDGPPRSHHTPDFYIDESGLKLGVRTYCRMALDYLSDLE